MKTIWKYPVEVTDRIEIEMPRGARVLSVQLQDGSPCIWVLIPDPTAPKERRHFQIYGTGHPVDGSGEFIGTFQMMEGQLVFHLFEV